MLLNKRILICGILFLLLASIVSAQVCEVDRIKDVLRKILFLYYTEPASVSLTQNEVKDLLVFYLSIKDQNLTVDCSAFGALSTKPISDVVNQGDNLPDKIPSCADGTKYGRCSGNKPGYCYAGSMQSKCGLCGCPTNSVCGKSDKCETSGQNIICFKDIDCGQISLAGDYYCANNYIARGILNYSCVNPGTSASRCVTTNGTVWLTYCNANLNQTCVAGQSYCKASIINTTAASTNQTSFDTITVKGRYVDKFTGQPLKNIGFWLLKSPSTNLGTFYTDANGYFAVTMSTTEITETIYKVLAHQANCYISDNGIVISKYPSSYKITGFDYTAGALYVWINYFDLSGNPKFFPVTSTEINVGDVPLWPSADFSLSSDIPVKFDISYPEEGRGAGNGNYLTSHYLRNVIPLNYNVRAQLTDSLGNIYFSPYTNVPLSNGCTAVNLNFLNKQFAWNGTTKNATSIGLVPTLSFAGYTWTPINVTYNSDPSNGYGNWYIASDGMRQDQVSALHYKIVATSMTPQNDYDVIATVSLRSGSEIGVCGRMDNNGNGYCFATNWGGGGGTQIASLTNNNQNPNGMSAGNGTSIQPSADYIFKVRFQGNSIYGKVYPANSAEPSGWNAQATDYSNIFSNGKIGFYTYGSQPTIKSVSVSSITNANQTTPTGICLIRDSYTSVPVFSAPDFGNGYAKITKPGVSTISGLQSSCSQSDYANLLTSYCTQNSNPIQQQVMTYDTRGNYQSLSCGAFGCNYVNCPAANQTTPANQTSSNQTNSSQPDLIVSDITFVPANPTTADYIKVLLTVKNIGTATAGSSIVTLDYRSQYHYTQTLGINILAPGSSQTVDTSSLYGWNTSNSFSAGTYFFNATADAFNAVAESNENNNALSKSLIVTSQANQTSLSPTGVCLIRDSYTSVPLFSDPDVGKGYAKTAKPGVNIISGLQSACTQADFSNLLQSYCASNSNPIQQQVMTYDSTGHWSSLSCGAFGCNFVSCP